MTAPIRCAWRSRVNPDTTVEDYPVHAECVPAVTAYIGRRDRGAPRVVPWSTVRPALASGYVPTGGRGARPVDAVLASGRAVPEDVPRADVIDAVGRRRGGGR